MSVKRPTAGVWEGRFSELEWKYYIYFSIETREWDLKILLFNYQNNLDLGSLETHFREVGE